MRSLALVVLVALWAPLLVGAADPSGEDGRGGCAWTRVAGTALAPTSAGGDGLGEDLGDFLPAPWGKLLGGALSLAGIGLAGRAELARRRGRKMIRALAEGIDLAGDPATKKAARDRARDLRISGAVEEEVAELARKAGPTPQRPKSPGPHPKPSKKGRAKP